MKSVRVPPQRVVEVIVLVQGLVFGLGAVLLARRGDLETSALSLVFAAVVVGATAVCAIILARRARTAAYSYVMLALVSLFPIGALIGGVWGWTSPGAILVRSLIPLATIYFIVSFDTGRPTTWADRRITAPALVLSVALLLALFVTMPQVPGGLVAVQCSDSCAAGWMTVVDAPAVGEALARIYIVVRAVAIGAMVVGVVIRLRRLTGSRRTEFLYLGVTALVWALVLLLQNAVQVADLFTYGPEGIYIAQLGLRVLLPLALLLGLMLAELSRGSTLERQFASIRSSHTVDDVRDQLRGLLEDPGLTVVPAGIDVPARSTACDLTELRAADGRMVATVIHRHGLASDVPVPYAVSMPAATAALERIAVAQQMQDLERDVAEARATALTAGDAERARIERDLHDGAQARIVMLRARMNRLARDSRSGEDGLANDIAALGADLDAVLHEVRSLSAGLRPIRPGTLVPSLRDHAAGLPVPVRVNAGEIGAIPDGVELAVYFCIREALQNVAKHAGPGATATVGLTRDGRALRFVVEDDGVGIPPDGTALTGTGVQGMQARITAIGGTLAVKPTPGGGTRVSGEVPLQAGAPLLLDR